VMAVRASAEMERELRRAQRGERPMSLQSAYARPVESGRMRMGTNVQPPPLRARCGRGMDRCGQIQPRSEASSTA
jgi:hypothetical protein